MLEDISHTSDNREKINEICEVFFKENIQNNPSWSKVHKTLKEADPDCNEAKKVDMYLPITMLVLSWCCTHQLLNT